MPRFDKLDTDGRSALMATIRKKNTKPEIAVRRLLHAMGYRFRLHRRDLAGTPDIALSGSRKAIFVHGCFWHRHNCAVGRKFPTSNAGYWRPKFVRTCERDRRSREELLLAGWQSLVIWECELADPTTVEARLERFLRDDGEQ